MNEYVKTEWVDDDIPALDADNLNHIEDGLERATNAIKTLESRAVPVRAANVELETDTGYVTPRDVYRIIDAVFLENDLRLVNGKLVYTDIDGTDHVLGE